ncbi:MAG: hypothetical protein R3F49_21390 [Planctomycetota bacterium]
MKSKSRLDRVFRAAASFVSVRRAALLSLGLASALGLGAAVSASQDKDALPTGGLITLYQHDAVGSSLSFQRGEHGGRVSEGQVDLSQAQLVYGAFATGLLTVGFSADEAVNVVDLGELLVEPISLAQDAAMKFPISAFSSLSVSGRKLVYQPAGGSFVRLGAGNEVFGVPQRGLVNFEPKLGHCYALRYQRTRGDRRDVLAKFQVVEHRPGESVTLRWANIGSL